MDNQPLSTQINLAAAKQFVTHKNDNPTTQKSDKLTCNRQIANQFHCNIKPACYTTDIQPASSIQSASQHIAQNFPSPSPKSGRPEPDLALTSTQPFSQLTHSHRASTQPPSQHNSASTQPPSQHTAFTQPASQHTAQRASTQPA